MKIVCVHIHFTFLVESQLYCYVNSTAPSGHHWNYVRSPAYKKDVFEFLLPVVLSLISVCLS
jgi:hypothetical protein